MSFFALPNLKAERVSPNDPWAFKPDRRIPHEVRSDSRARQRWYGDPATCHNFFTAVEGHNAQSRCSPENPPAFLHGLVADYDTPLRADTILFGLPRMPCPPSFIARSVGGNFHLVWVFAEKIPVTGWEFAIYLLQRCFTWLELWRVVGLDYPSLINPGRLFCNGCDWTAVAAEPVPATSLRAFLAGCQNDFTPGIGRDWAACLAGDTRIQRKLLSGVVMPGRLDPARTCSPLNECNFGAYQSLNRAELLNRLRTFSLS